NRLKGRSFPFKGIIAYPPGVKARFTIFWFLLSFLQFAPKAREYIFDFMLYFMYVYAFLYFALRSPLHPSAKRWDTAKRLRGATKKRPLARAPARLYIF